VLAKYTRFRPATDRQGIGPFREGSGELAVDRFTCRGRSIPRAEVLVLNGSREGLFFAALTAARYVGPRKGKPAILMPNPFYPAVVAPAAAGGGVRARSICRTTLANGFSARSRSAR